LRRVSIERGHDPAEFWLVAFGGAGPLHACELAGRLGMKGVVVPRWPGLFSALGMVLADMTVEKSRTVLGRAIPWKDLEREALAELKGRVERFVEARYRGQSHEIRVPEQGDFHEAHRRLYGFTRREPVEVVNAVVRVTATHPRPRWGRPGRSGRPFLFGRLARSLRRRSSPGSPALWLSREEDLRTGHRITGPATVMER